MRRITVGLVAAALLASSAPTASAAPVTSATPTPATPAPPRVTTRADVDGDGRRDAVELTRRRVTPDEYTFRIDVRTATGRRAVRDVLVPNYGDGSLTPEDVWDGTAAVDGAPGVEIAVDRSGGVGDFPWPHLYTWRTGRLVPVAAPGASAGDLGWMVADHFTLVAGYDVRTVKGVRQLTATHLDGRFGAGRERLTFRGTRLTYRWQHGAWVKSATRRVGPLWEDAALRHAGWHGVTWRR
ncbi:hypothetical protein [Mobilicoccus pelagius]|uniref:Uncharacterized protein n=1 Tax=Mobilicoccus pelagius NBRC 104925 TaxID=1089455 RepID=H5UN17_9MICO|nr:hypothetical protein [Mobilicoccus pelagius]GAB47125.1 hypothetical protein MOPEL_003_01510 [Mobilicoccus pelagius NBRC 104925]